MAEMLTSTLPNLGRNLVYSAVYPFASGLKLSALHLFYGRLMRMESLKVKGTGRIEDDLGYVRAIRQAHPYPVSMRLDLNGSLQPQNAEEYFSRMLESECRIGWFEQPFQKNDWEACVRFQQMYQTDIVLCGDESICSIQDLERAAREHAFRAVNIRIAKNGGLLESLRIYRRAIEAGFEVQLGALVGETSVLAHAGLHFAAVADSLRHYEGCFGTYLIKWDVIQPSLTFSRRGYVALGRLASAGLAPSFDVDRLRRKAFQSEILARTL